MIQDVAGKEWRNGVEARKRNSRENEAGAKKKKERRNRAEARKKKERRNFALRSVSSLFLLCPGLDSNQHILANAAT